MKSFIILFTLFFLGNIGTTNAQVVDTTFNKKLVKNVNLNLTNIKGGLLFSGVTFTLGSIFNIIAINKREPDPKDYKTTELYEKAINSYNSNQKSLTTVGTTLFGAGGIALFITAFHINNVKMKTNSEKTVSFKTFSLAYNF